MAAETISRLEEPKVQPVSKDTEIAVVMLKSG